MMMMRPRLNSPRVDVERRGERFITKAQVPRNGGGTRLAFPLNALFFGAVLSSFLMLLGVLYVALADKLEELNQERAGGHVIKVPTTIRDLKELQGTMKVLVENHFWLVLTAYCALYIFKQTFSIPGSVALNIAGGLILGRQIGWPLVCVLSASGATMCYFISWVAAEQYVSKISANSTSKVARTLDHLRTKSVVMQQQQGRLTFLLYLVSVRIFPGTPNWLINVALPHCNVPVHLFSISVFIGLMPYNFVTVSAGDVLGSIDSATDIFDTALLLKFCFAAVAVAGFAPLVQYFQRKLGQQQQQVNLVESR